MEGVCLSSRVNAATASDHRFSWVHFLSQNDMTTLVCHITAIAPQIYGIPYVFSVHSTEESSINYIGFRSSIGLSLIDQNPPQALL